MGGTTVVIDEMVRGPSGATYDRSVITDALGRFARRRATSLVLVAWGFAEATILLFVPDLLLYPLVVAAPRRAVPLFGWALAGALLGSLVLSAVTLSDPATGRGLVLGVPGIHDQTIEAAEAAVRDGDPLAMVHLGPGTPLKVYSVAWWAGAGTVAAYLVGVVANRLVRIGSGVLVFALLGALAPRWIRRHERIALAAYAIFWGVVAALAIGIERTVGG